MTPYREVYDVFVSKITDYSFLDLSEDQLKDIFKRYLRTATSRFIEYKGDLSDRDDTLEEFNSDLTDLEVEILATLMIVAWLDNKVLSTQTISQFISDKDFKIYSQANHLDALMKLQASKQEEADGLIMQYNYLDKDNLEDLR